MAVSIRTLMGSLLVFFAISANAGPVINGFEWNTDILSADIAWSDIDAICHGGSCNGQLGGNGPDLTGWTWANTEQLNRLFNHVLNINGFGMPLGPGPGGISDSPGGVSIPGVILHMSSLLNVPISGDVFFRASGWLSSPQTPNSDTAAWGSAAGFNVAGWSWSMITGAERLTNLAPSPSARTSAWLIRAANVPAPSSLLLIVAALPLLWSCIHRRRPAL